MLEIASDIAKGMVSLCRLDIRITLVLAAHRNFRKRNYSQRFSGKEYSGKFLRKRFVSQKDKKRWNLCCFRFRVGKSKIHRWWCWNDKFCTGTSKVTFENARDSLGIGGWLLKVLQTKNTVVNRMLFHTEWFCMKLLLNRILGPALL